jgi:Domain of unknown function (DUF362)/Secretion system C-terminal sorting domain
MEQMKSSACPHHHRSEKHHKNFRQNKLLRLFFPLIGLVSLIWMLVRIIPKPSRAEYPCMKVAAPIAGGFIAYIAGLAAIVFSFNKAKRYFQKSSYVLASVLVVAGISAGLFTFLQPNSETFASTRTIVVDSLFVPTDSANHPIGTARGIFPGRVVWLRDSTAAHWNGTSGNWWSEANTNQTVVDSMLSSSLRSLTGKSSDTASWNALFSYFNQQHGKGNAGYGVGEKIAVKININNSTGLGNTGNASVATPQMVLSLLRQLVNKAGVPDSNITFYDLIRFIPTPVYTKCKGEFPNVHFMGWVDTLGREKYVRDSTTYLHWAQNLIIDKDPSVSAKGGNTTFLPTAVTRAAYLINLGNLKAHSYAGITCCAKNHFGSLSVDDDFGQPYIWAPHAAGVHGYVVVHNGVQWSSNLVYAPRPMGSYNALVDLMGHKDLGGKTLLFMVDALYAVKNEHGDNLDNTSRWKSAPFNNNWTSSLFLSQDNVAIESVCLDFLRTEQAANPINYTLTTGAVDNYLHEAALANNPPSGTYYSPSGDGVRLQSLGVHEHWNNATDKKYTRNLNPTTGTGIELVSLHPTIATSVATETTVPSVFTLRQNYPNPFNPSTTIAFTLPLRSFVTLKIFDMSGREVAILASEELLVGDHIRQWNAQGFSSGVYYYRIQAGSYTETKKLILLK